MTDVSQLMKGLQKSLGNGQNISEIMGQLNIAQNGGQSSQEAQELLKVFNPALWNKVVDMQDGFNENVVTNWKNQNLDWWMAIIDEVVEILNSKSWKWWKGTDNYQKVDLANVEVEMIDIFHFLLSLAIQNKHTDFIYSILVAQSYGKSDKYIKDPDKLIEKVRKEMLVMSSFNLFEMVFVTWAEIWFGLDKSINDLVKSYMLKNALNIHRQKFGYKEGKYVKVWGDKEDNVIAWELSDNIDLNEKFFENILQELEKYYVTKVIQ